MSMTVISGVVTGYRERADTSVTHTVNQNPNMSSTVHVETKRTASFRIGNRAVFMNTAPNLMDGDLVTAAGKQTSGEFKVVAVRNETTSMIYWEPFVSDGWNLVLVTGPIWMLLLCFLDRGAGLFCAFLFGPFLTITGVWMYIKAIPTKGAIALLRATPRPATVQQA
jgi:hypothetical protein